MSYLAYVFGDGNGVTLFPSAGIARPIRCVLVAVFATLRKRRRILIVTVTLFFAATLFTRRLVYPCPSSPAVPHIAGGQLIHVARGDHEVFGFLTRRGSQLVVILHGNRSTIKREESTARELAARGFSSLIVEYPGYGLASAQHPSEAAICNDASAIVMYVQSAFGYTKASTTLWGRSLGSGVAAELAHRGLGERLVLVTAYTSIIDVAEHETIPCLPYLFVWDRFDTLDKAVDIRMPVLIIHGERDTLTPIEMGYRLQKAFANASMLVLPATGHFDVYRKLKPSDWERIVEFLGA